jgi:hypothetical protein
MAIRYVDFEGGNDANDGTTYALRKKSIFSAIAGLAAGDTIRVMGSPDPTSLGQNATFTNNSDTVTLTTAVTANIDTCESAWTASANVTATAQSTTWREGTNAASLVIASGFTTGLIAYRATGALNLSAYKQISFLIRANSSIAANTLTLTLCSDAAGVTAVHTVPIPALPTGHWLAVVFDTGAALSASVQSVALNALLDPGSRTVFLDNIIACKDSTAADSLTHNSLIGKNTGDEPWMAIDSINGTTIKLGGGYQSTASRTGFQPYYYGTTATQTLYKREPVVIPAQSFNGGGSLNYEFGWDRTAMTTQDTLTVCRAPTPDLTLFAASTTSECHINKVYVVAAATGLICNAGWTFGEFAFIACIQGLSFYQNSDSQAFTNALRYFMHCGFGFDTANSAGTSGSETRLRIRRIWGITQGAFPTQFGAISDDASSANCRLVLVDCDIQGCPTAFYSTTARRFNEVIFQNCTLSKLYRQVYTEAGKTFFINCTIAGGIALVLGSTSIVYYVNQGGDTTSHAIVFGQYTVAGGSVASDTSTRHTASDFSWKLTSTNNAGKSNWPNAFLSVAKVACVANEQRTVKLWMRRNNVDLVTRLRVKGGLVAGIDYDITSAMTAAINTWEQVTIQFTPTQKCVVEVFAEVYARAADAWVDDLEVT